jgi:Cu+-exporting ATPase
MRKVDTLVVDKTGTLTEGKPRLVAVEGATAGFAEAELLACAASLERNSEHPLAGAIVDAARHQAIELEDVESFESVTGKGVKGRIGRKKIALGNAALMADLSVDVPASIAERVDVLRSQGQTVMFAAIDGALAGYLGVADPIKPTTPDALRHLRDAGVRIVMLTGDNRRTADAVARALGIDDVIAGLLPEGKVAEIARLQQAGHVVAMAGDGVNDAPALAKAQVGIAMGNGTDIAMSSAAVTLVKGDLIGIARARQLSEATVRNIKQNLFFAFVYNALGVPVAAGVLYPAFGVLLSPMIAALAMSASSVSVIGNALRLKRVRF